MRNFNSVRDLQSCIGQEIGVSGWVTIDQHRINAFADATGDHQWIHVDTERAAQGPYSSTIAHGYLTLSLIPMLAAQAMNFGDVKMGINYGVNRVRLPSPVKVNSRVRCRFRLLNLEELPRLGELAGFQITMEATIDCEGSVKPAVVAETVGRRYF